MKINKEYRMKFYYLNIKYCFLFLKKLRLNIILSKNYIMDDF